MHFSELTAAEQRVLGCLIEKRWTTPDQYPLSLNALRLACNQSTNRDPVTDYDEATVREAAQRLSLYGLARLASGHGSRATKYRHLAEEGLGLGREQLAILAVLLLRGAQTPGEIKARSERMAEVGSLADVEQLLAALCDRGYARRLPRRPGQKEERFEHMLGSSHERSAVAAGDHGGPDIVAAATAAHADPSATTSGSPQTASYAGVTAPVGQVAADPLAARVATLEREVRALRAQVNSITAELGLETGREPSAAGDAASDETAEPTAVQVTPSGLAEASG